MKVCIDAGHGVETAGKRSPDGSYFEHEFNFDVAKRIKAHLQRCGVQVVMTRENEHDVSLSERCKICNDAGCVYFFSVHTNAAGNDGWYDAEGWSAHIIAKGGKAEQMAAKIRSYAIVQLGCKDRGINVDNYQVLRDTKCPAVLVEHGFHTSRTEVARLKTPEYRARCAESDARGICAQLGVVWKPEPPVVTPQPPVVTPTPPVVTPEPPAVTPTPPVVTYDTVSVRRVIEGEFWLSAADLSLETPKKG